MCNIHPDHGHGYDQKYSKWRRNIFPRKANLRTAYCTDIDWIEWRNGKPVAIIECRRAIGTLQNAEEAIEHFKSLNRGFQYEVLARLAYQLRIPAYIVGIQDKNPQAEDYSDAVFVVEEVIPPDQWPSSPLPPSCFLCTKRLGKLTEAEYVQFIAQLGQS